jgi:hypothetical protein
MVTQTSMQMATRLKGSVGKMKYLYSVSFSSVQVFIGLLFLIAVDAQAASLSPDRI